jgi:hypothetical protein
METRPQNRTILRAAPVAALSALALAFSPPDFEKASFGHVSEASAETAQQAAKAKKHKYIGKWVLKYDPDRALSHMTLVFEKPKPKPIKIPWLLQRIGGCESLGNPHAKIDYQAESKISTASGGFQVLDSTWGGYKGYARAIHAPKRIQQQFAVKLYREEGTTPWVSSIRCWQV